MSQKCLVNIVLIQEESVLSKKKRKKSAGRIVLNIILVAAIIIFCVAAYMLWSIFHDYHASEEEYEKIAGEVIAEDPEDEDGFTIDFAKLQSENPDCIGWIRFENIDISYPIMHGTDNDYYLHHTFDGQELKAGSIFMDCENSADFSDMNTIIYGHNMKNDTMFGRLHDFEKKENWENNPSFLIYTPDGTYRYDIFSCYTVKNLTYTIFYDESDEYTQYVQKLKGNSAYDTGVEVSGTDKIVTLSTCTAAGDNYRYIVNGVLAEKIE